ncbi:hypothetical protein Goarm_022322 [Gossypium armourianum]|uniref:Uncharacterized protein n=1 Tax=Gossypium armourianum TaxID=34283 RepID=A0A7J9KGW0_9ROSI|nr:hypothetical protein [Gossypium armourianum]
MSSSTIEVSGEKVKAM